MSTVTGTGFIAKRPERDAQDLACRAFARGARSMWEPKCEMPANLIKMNPKTLDGGYFRLSEMVASNSMLHERQLSVLREVLFNQETGEIKASLPYGMLLKLCTGFGKTPILAVIPFLAFNLYFENQVKKIGKPFDHFEDALAFMKSLIKDFYGIVFVKTSLRENLINDLKTIFSNNFACLYYNIQSTDVRTKFNRDQELTNRASDGHFPVLIISYDQVYNLFGVMPRTGTLCKEITKKVKGHMKTVPIPSESLYEFVMEKRLLSIMLDEVSEAKGPARRRCIYAISKHQLENNHKFRFNAGLGAQILDNGIYETLNLMGLINPGAKDCKEMTTLTKKRKYNSDFALLNEFNKMLKPFLIERNKTEETGGRQINKTTHSIDSVDKETDPKIIAKVIEALNEFFNKEKHKFENSTVQSAQAKFNAVISTIRHMFYNISCLTIDTQASHNKNLYYDGKLKFREILGVTKPEEPKLVDISRTLDMFEDEEELSDHASEEESKKEEEQVSDNDNDEGKIEENDEDDEDGTKNVNVVTGVYQFVQNKGIDLFNLAPDLLKSVKAKKLIRDKVTGVTEEQDEEIEETVQVPITNVTQKVIDKILELYKAKKKFVLVSESVSFCYILIHILHTYYRLPLEHFRHVRDVPTGLRQKFLDNFNSFSFEKSMCKGIFMHLKQGKGINLSTISNFITVASAWNENDLSQFVDRFNRPLPAKAQIESGYKKTTNTDPLFIDEFQVQDSLISQYMKKAVEYKSKIAMSTTLNYDHSTDGKQAEKHFNEYIDIKKKMLNIEDNAPQYCPIVKTSEKNQESDEEELPPKKRVKFEELLPQNGDQDEQMNSETQGVLSSNGQIVEQENELME